MEPRRTTCPLLGDGRSGQLIATGKEEKERGMREKKKRGKKKEEKERGRRKEREDREEGKRREKDEVGGERGRRGGKLERCEEEEKGR